MNFFSSARLDDGKGERICDCGENNKKRSGNGGADLDIVAGGENELAVSELHAGREDVGEGRDGEDAGGAGGNTGQDVGACVGAAW
jgi:hypothetical protein